MDKELFRNGSGYADPTAYKALKNYQRGHGDMEFKRGEIFQYKIGSEYREALVVSADYRANDNILNIIVLDDEARRDSVQIVCRGIKYADCSFISYGYANSFGAFIRKATELEMEEIDEGIAKSLGIPATRVEEKIVEVEKPSWAEPVEDFVANEELTKAKAEAEIYKDLYEKLLAKMLG